MCIVFKSRYLGPYPSVFEVWGLIFFVFEGRIRLLCLFLARSSTSCSNSRECSETWLFVRFLPRFFQELWKIEALWIFNCFACFQSKKCRVFARIWLFLISCPVVLKRVIERKPKACAARLFGKKFQIIPANFCWIFTLQCVFMVSTITKLSSRILACGRFVNNERVIIFLWFGNSPTFFLCTQCWRFYQALK
jgi:hypothetical protein